MEEIYGRSDEKCRTLLGLLSIVVLWQTSWEAVPQTPSLLDYRQSKSFCNPDLRVSRRTAQRATFLVLAWYQRCRQLIALLSSLYVPAKCLASNKCLRSLHCFEYFDCNLSSSTSTMWTALPDFQVWLEFASESTRATRDQGCLNLCTKICFTNAWFWSELHDITTCMLHGLSWHPWNNNIFDCKRAYLPKIFVLYYSSTCQRNSMIALEHYRLGAASRSLVRSLRSSGLCSSPASNIDKGIKSIDNSVPPISKGILWMQISTLFFPLFEESNAILDTI